MKTNFRHLLESGEIIDLFAGGGGASQGIEEASGRHVSVAINHNPVAISIHTVNHRKTKHYISDIFEVDPVEATGGRPVLQMHTSPDCCHFSQSRGGQPRDKKIRALSWVTLKWIGKTHPAIATLENVVQIQQWGNLVAKRDPNTGRVVKLDGSVAKQGERVPVHEQFLIPDKHHLGKTWQRFINALRKLGYAVEFRVLKACDYGAPTSRTRLFLVARNDGLPIAWPKPTHGVGKGLLPYRTAAECIDWNMPCPSIFTRKRPLAAATLRRIAKGIQKYVIDSNEPFIVPAAQQGNVHTRPIIVPIQHYNGNGDTAHSAGEPLRTITANPKGGSFALAVPVLTSLNSSRHSEDRSHSVNTPIPTATALHGIVTAHLEQANTGAIGHSAREPLSTITATGAQQRLVTATMVCNTSGHDASGPAEPLDTITTGNQHAVITAKLEKLGPQAVAFMSHFRTSNTCGGKGKLDEPLTTLTAGGEHQGLVECDLSAEATKDAERVAAFMIQYYSAGGQLAKCDEPLQTVTAKHRMGLVTVTISGTVYTLVDVGLRMLSPRELFRAQGFADNYVIDTGNNGEKISKANQVRLCGNSVSPPVARALIAANLEVMADVVRRQEKAA